MAPDQITRETTIDAPVERVWALLTEAEHLGRWFGDAGAEIDLRPGGALVLRWSGYGTVLGRIETIEPQRRFAYRWGLDHQEPGEGNSTLVDFTLTPTGDGTLLRVVESGFASLARTEEQRVARCEENTEGWGQELGELATYASRVAV